MKKLNRVSAAILVSGLIVLFIGLINTTKNFPVEAQQPLDEEEFFGFVGITAGQTVRLNVVNTADGGEPQTRTLKFVGESGSVIVNTFGQPVQTTVTLAPGEAAFLDLNGSDIPGIGTGRVQIRGVDPTCPGCRIPFGVIQTLEIFDRADSRTNVFYAPPNPITPPNPVRLSSFGMVGIAAGQIARLNVWIPNGPPTRVILRFVGSNGQTFVNSDGMPFERDVTLEPGLSSASLTMGAGSILTGSQTRAQLRPLVIKPEGPPVRLVSTLELIDSATGKTDVLVLPAATHPACP